MMSTQLMERPTTETMQETHEADRLVRTPVPVKQLLRWQDDGGAVHAEVESA